MKKKQAGRKPLSSGESTTQITIRLTESQKQKLIFLGGAKFVRDQINGAKRNEIKGG